MTDKSLEILARAFAGKADEEGNPLCLHSLRVGLRGVTEEERCAGFLHEVFMYSDVTEEELMAEGIHSGVVSAVKLLTRGKDVSFEEFIGKIIASSNPVALRVIINDLEDRMASYSLTGKKQESYGTALEKLHSEWEKMNAVSLYTPEKDTDVAVFACGCFWGVQYQMQKLQGVKRTLVGYTGGKEKYPSYEQVRSHKTSHVEAVVVEYDRNVITYETLCKVFFEIHDPADIGGQGPDRGEQYLSRIFYTDDSQKQTAENIIKDLRSRSYVVNTLLLPLTEFYTAEQYHQHYYAKTGGSPYCHIREKKF